MGAWGVGPFENDDAADWVYELEAGEGLDVLRSALSLGELDYVEAPEGSIALAAAEIVAASGGQPHPELPEEPAAWLASNGGQVTEAERQLARQAVARVGAEGSELAELWEDAGAEAWRATLDDVNRRLA